MTTELTIAASPSPLVKEQSGLSQVLYARVCGQLLVKCFLGGPIENFLPMRLVKVDKIHLVVIVETDLAGNGFPALSCSNFKGQGPRTEGEGFSRSHRSDILSAQPQPSRHLSKPRSRLLFGLYDFWAESSSWEVRHLWLHSP